ncbi:MAG: DUF3570 domain-containing protein, partial [Crocinitomicaceae bacterium]|nr:DUF3570 domain-containing protein [Crocinitomicaceae bacterium]
MRMQLKFKILFLLPLIQAIAFGQADSVEVEKDTIEIKKPVDPMDVNFIFSYYEQDGIHSPVTGGIGDEELHDYVAKISVTLPITQKITTTITGGIDHYTSASTDNINNQFDADAEETSASYVDDRIYTDIGIQFENKKKRRYFGFNGGLSQEWDVDSFNAGAFYAKTSKDDNKQIKFNASYFNDKWELIYPTELRKFDGTELLDVSLKQLFDVFVTGSAIINKRMQASITLEGVYQTGLLSTPFHRAYFTDTTHNIEILPKSRLKLPIGIHSSFYLSNFMILKMYYRFYIDDFGIQAHTAEIEVPLKVHKLIRINPFYRFHIQ